METLEEMRQRHRAVARYSVAVKCMKESTVLFTGLHYDVANTVCDQLQEEWIASLPGKVARFTTPVHLIQLENADACMTQDAKARRLLVTDGKRG